MKPEVNRSDGEAQAEEEIMMVMFVCQSGRESQERKTIHFIYWYCLGYYCYYYLPISVGSRSTTINKQQGRTR